MGAGLSAPFWEGSLAALAAQSQLRRMRQAGSAPGPEMELDGRRVIQFASNNYLGLATHPKVLAAAGDALRRYGAGAGASRLLAGNLPPHQSLESALAAFKGAEAALAYASGSMANTGLLSCLAGEADAYYLDKACHATLYDGARLSGAAIRRFPHNDLARLESLLSEGWAGDGRRLVVAEAVYSMDGDLAPLPELLKLCERHGAYLIVDEAHSTGVLGTRGGGVLEHFGLPWHPLLILCGTLSKALGSQGGYVAGPSSLIQWLVNSSRSFIFATALAPASAAAAEEALRLVVSEPALLDGLRANRARLASGLGRLGWDLRASESPILPLIIGPADKALALQERLWEAGYFAPAIRPPTVPAGLCRLRLSITSAHSSSHIDGFLDALGTPS